VNNNHDKSSKSIDRKEKQAELINNNSKPKILKHELSSNSSTTIDIGSTRKRKIEKRGFDTEESDYP